jgi:hypothetical protein
MNKIQKMVTSIPAFKEKTMMDSENLKKLVNSSGFPLQIAIENLIQKRTSSPGWRISSREHAWKNNDTLAEGFIDLILCDPHGTSYFVIECKRVLDSSWIFLQPSKNQDNRRHVKTWVSRIAGAKESQRHFGWADINVEPITAESEFCVVAGHDSKSKPMLERIAADVIEATEGLAYEEMNFLEEADVFRMYFNMVVTTAELQLCRFDPDKISLKDGKLSDADFLSVPYLRFRKQLSVKKYPYSFVRQIGYQGFLRAKENTVFIVNTNHFWEFLQAFEVDNDSIRRFI